MSARTFPTLKYILYFSLNLMARKGTIIRTDAKCAISAVEATPPVPRREALATESLHRASATLDSLERIAM